MNLPEILLSLLAINALTFFAFWRDKRMSQRGGWRVPEGTLLGLSLIGGWPAAVVAMRVLRHKNRKTSFQIRFWLVVCVNLGLVGYYFWNM